MKPFKYLPRDHRSSGVRTRPRVLVSAPRRDDLLPPISFVAAEKFATRESIRSRQHASARVLPNPMIALHAE
jgi:hypothetical protein